MTGVFNIEGSYARYTGWLDFKRGGLKYIELHLLVPFHIKKEYSPMHALGQH